MWQEVCTAASNAVVLSQERNLWANDLQMQQDLNGRLQRDVERYKNREQLLAKVNMCLKGSHMLLQLMHVVYMQGLQSLTAFYILVTEELPG